MSEKYRYDSGSNIVIASVGTSHLPVPLSPPTNPIRRKRKRNSITNTMNNNKSSEVSQLRSLTLLFYY